MLDNGTVCVKTCGRDAGKIAVVVDQINDIYVLIDGQVRRKKCNRLHLEPLGQRIKIKPNVPSDIIINELKKLGIDVKKSKPKESTKKQAKQRMVKKDSIKKTRKRKNGK